MRRLVVAVALVLVACGILPAHAQTLTLGFKQGDHYSYSLHFNGTFTVQAGAISQDVKFDAKANETVAITSVESDGTADVTITFAKLTVTTTGKSPDGSTSTTTTTETSALPPQQLKVAPDGRVLSVNGESISATSPFGVLVGGDLAYAVLPDTAVKPGDKWSKSYDQASPGGGSTVHVTSNSTYLRDESFHGVNAAVVETKSTAVFSMSFGSIGPPPPSAPSPPAGTPGIPGGVGSAGMQGTVTSDTTSWIDPSAHRVLKSTMKASLKASITGIEGTETTPIAGGVAILGSESLDLEPA